MKPIFVGRVTNCIFIFCTVTCIKEQLTVQNQNFVQTRQHFLWGETTISMGEHPENVNNCSLWIGT
jgi:hypothetical protein